MSAPIVFFDIASPDSASLSEFYSTVFGWKIDSGGQFSTGVISPTLECPTLMAAIRQDPTEKIIYLGVEDIDATLKQIEAEGGKIDQPRFEVPGVVVLGLFVDPAGNRMGLVEMENGTAKVP